jgi:hypothetical protein
MRMDTLHSSRPPALLAGPLDTRLITTRKPIAGILPIAVQEVWIHHFAFSIMEGWRTKDLCNMEKGRWKNIDIALYIDKEVPVSPF